MTNDAFSIVPTFQIGHVMGQILRNNVKHLCHQILCFSGKFTKYEFNTCINSRVITIFRSSRKRVKPG